MSDLEKDIYERNLYSIDTDYFGKLEDDDFGGSPMKTNSNSNTENMRILSGGIDSKGNMEIKKNWDTNNCPSMDTDSIDTTFNLRSIDLEYTPHKDDSEYDIISKTNPKKDTILPSNFTSEETPKSRHYGFTADFSDEDDEDYLRDINSTSPEADFEKELVIEEKREDNIDQGTIEKNYLSKLQKKHKESNVKGSYNSYFHLCGDPEKEVQMFNHDMGSDATSNSEVASSEISSSSCCESKSNSKDSLLEELLGLLGFNVVTDNDKFILKDQYELTPDAECSNKNEVYMQLHPYIKDIIITPLQFNTGEKFEEPEEWISWYAEKGKDFPQCEKDIDYCKCIYNEMSQGK